MIINIIHFVDTVHGSLYRQSCVMEKKSSFIIFLNDNYYGATDDTDYDNSDSVFAYQCKC